MASEEQQAHVVARAYEASDDEEAGRRRPQTFIRITSVLEDVDDEKVADADPMEERMKKKREAPDFDPLSDKHHHHHHAKRSPAKKVQVLSISRLLDRIALTHTRLRVAKRAVLYVLFILVFAVMLLMQRNSEKAFSLEASLKTRFQREYDVSDGNELMLEDIETVDEIFEWLEYGLSEVVFADQSWYNGDEVEGEEDVGYVMFYNKPVSPFQLVQHRVEEKRAKSTKFRGFYPVEWPRIVKFDEQVGTAKEAVAFDLEDYLEGRLAKEDKSAFGPAWDPQKYEWSGDQDGAFGGGGFFVEFSSDRDISKLMLQELKKDRWIDKQTRRVMCVVPYYNANFRLFALARLAFELDAGGGVSTRLELRSTRLELYETGLDALRVVLELVFVLALVAQGVAMIHAAYHAEGGVREYFGTSGLNCVDLARIIASFVCAGLYIRTLTHDLRTDQKDALAQDDGPRFGKTVEQSTTFLDLPSLVQREDDYYLATAVVTLLTVAVLFKYLMPFPRVRILVESVVYSLGELSIFLCLMVVVAAGYSVLGVILFGHVVEDYKSVARSFVSVCRFMFDVEAGRYDDLVDAAGIISTSLFYWTFLIVITVLFLNIALAIVIGAYEYVKRETDHLKHSEKLGVPLEILRYCLLWREPSLEEKNQSILCLVATRARLAFRRGRFLCCSCGHRPSCVCAEQRPSFFRSNFSMEKMLSGHVHHEKRPPIQTVDTMTTTHVLKLFEDVLGATPHEHGRELETSLNTRRKRKLEHKILAVAAANDKVLEMAADTKKSAHLLHDHDPFIDLDDESTSDSDTSDSETDGAERSSHSSHHHHHRHHHHEQRHRKLVLQDVPLVAKSFQRLLQVVVKDKQSPYSMAPRDVDMIADALFKRHCEVFHPPTTDATFQRQTVVALNDLAEVANDAKNKVDDLDAKVHAEALHAKLDTIIRSLPTRL